MKTSALLMIISFSTVLSFIGSYFFNLTANNIEQFISIGIVVLLDGLFGMIAGTKREGFQTFKALTILRTLGIWWLILGAILSIESAFIGTGWLSETVLAPFLIFQIISTIKNASMAGFIKSETLNSILDKIDQHKGSRK